jgi:dihydrofolate synthase / folylpolyglutamate synthase
MDLPSLFQPRTPEIQFLYGLRRGKTRLGLDSTRRLLRLLGSPERGVPMLHVAGTNGKGTTTALAASILHASGLRVGRFTSPHLLRVEERICVDGVPIGAEEFAARVRDMRRWIARADASFFEAMTAIAALHFREAGVQAAVYEVGLGGRLDSTNALPSSVSVITSIGHDHEAILGSGLRAVCREKLGIARPATPLHASLPDPELGALARAHCRRAGTPLRLLPADAARVLRIDPASGMHFELRGPRPERLWTRFLGLHQARNAALAAAAVSDLAAMHLGGLHPEVEAGVARGFFPGRFQVLPAGAGTPLVVLDVAHNPESLQATLVLARELFPASRPVVILGMLRDKRQDGIMPLLAGWARRLVLTTPQVERAWDAAAVHAHLATAAGELPVVVEPDVAAALDNAWQDSPAPVLVLGSHYLVGEALPILAAERQLALDSLVTGPAPDPELRATG